MKLKKKNGKRNTAEAYISFHFSQHHTSSVSTISNRASSVRNAYWASGLIDCVDFWRFWSCVCTFYSNTSKKQYIFYHILQRWLLIMANKIQTVASLWASDSSIFTLHICQLLLPNSSILFIMDMKKHVDKTASGAIKNGQIFYSCAMTMNRIMILRCFEFAMYNSNEFNVISDKIT